MAKPYKIPFASTGDKVTVPDAVQPDGSVSYSQGFGFDYERDLSTDPLAKAIPRESTNQILADATEAIGEIQLQGHASWYLLMAPYPVEARVRHNDKVWRSTTGNNSDEPGVGPGATSWEDISNPRNASQLNTGTVPAERLPSATETTIGAVEKATTAEAQSGTSDKFPDAAGVLAAISANPSGLGVDQTWQDVSASRSAGVTYTNSTGKPIMLSVTTVDASSMSVGVVTVGSSSSLTGNDYYNLYPIVPNGTTYKLNTGIIIGWAELR